MRLKKITLFLVIFALIFFSCKEDEPTQPTEATPNTYENQGTIGTDGGRIFIPENNSVISGAYVNVPEGALKNDVRISINNPTKTFFFEEDSAGIFVEFEPSGTQFTQPVEIGIPYSSNITNPNELQVYYFDKTETVWKSLPIVKLDLENKLIIAQTNHFSVFTSNKPRIKFDIELYKNIYGKISASVQLINNLNEIPTGLITYAATGAANMEELVKHQPFNVKSAYKVILKESKDFWVDPEIETKFVIYEVSSSDGALTYRIRVRDLDGNEIMLSPDYQSFPVLQEYYKGLPCLFQFDTTPSNSSDYYVEAQLYFTDRNLMYGGLFGNHGYYVENYDDAKSISEMNNAPDKDGDGIVNQYDLGTAPTVNINNPNDGDSFIYGEQINFSGYGYDTEDGDIAVEWSSDKDGFLSGDSEFSTSELSVNQHKITLTGEDSYGNISTDEITIFVNSQPDTEPPIINLVAPEPGTTVSGDVEIIVEATDNVGVSRVVFEVKENNSYQVIGEDTTPDANNRYRISWNTTQFSDGDHNIHATAYDAAGNNDNEGWQVSVDNFEEPNQQLVAYYPFAGNALDITGNGYNGVVNGARLVADRFENDDNAYNFDGSAYISVDNGVNFQFNEELTVSAWIKITNYNDDVHVIGNWSPGNVPLDGEAAFALAFLGSSPSDRGLHFVCADDPNTTYAGCKILNSNLPLNQWFHIVGTRDKENTKIYLNGVLMDTNVSGNTQINNPNQIFIMGAQSTSLRKSYVGELDDVRLYDRTLSENEITLLFHEGGWD